MDATQAVLGPCGQGCTAAGRARCRDAPKLASCQPSRAALNVLCNTLPPRPLCVPECRALQYNALTGTLPADLFKAHPMLEIVEVRMPMST